jgi:amidase
MVELEWVDGVGQAALVRRGEVSPFELVEAALRRIERLDSRLHAITALLADEALAAAASPDLPDGPFRGVPLLLKDLAVRQVGVPHWQGVPALRAAGIRARRDSLIGARLRQAGFVTLGTTITCQLGWGLAASPMGFDAVSNPWDLARSPGGSSGGSGAAVAGGMVPIATATDAGGSARLPASWCGLIGLKVSRGLVASDIVAAQVGMAPGRLRIGLLAELLPDTEADTRQALEEAGPELIDLGHDVEESHPDSFCWSCQPVQSWPSH